MIIPASREEWESLSPEELKGYSDEQLKHALKDYFGLQSQIYFMPVAKKREFILIPDSRPGILETADEKMNGHRERGATHRGKPKIEELIDERSDGRSYVFVGVDRPKDGFVDALNDRRAAIAYVIRDEADGLEFPVQKVTAKILTALKRLKGFDARISAKKQSPAHKAGAQTLEDVISGSDPKVQELAKAIETPEPTATVAVDATDERERELDDILNSIPQ